MTPINEWGTIAFERSFIRQMLQDDPRRGVENWLRMVPPAYRDDMKLWIERRFNPKWACQKATRETMAAVEEDILGFLRTAMPYRAPIPDDGSPWIADPSPWELRPEEHQRRMMDILATGPTRPGYQHSPATWVEGREAPRPCGHRGLPCECEDRKRATAREAEPAWSEAAPGVPLCDDSCVHHDGKRCELTGFRAGPICDPVVGAMAAMLTASASR